MTIGAKKWKPEQTVMLTNMVERQMLSHGYVDFGEIAKRINRTAKSCNQKAYSIGLLFQTKQKHIPESAPKPKYDMVNLPKHKNKLFVDYWEGNPNTKRVNYPAVWEVLRRKKL